MFQKRLAPPWSWIVREATLADRLPNRAAALQVQDIEGRGGGARGGGERGSRVPGAVRGRDQVQPPGKQGVHGDKRLQSQAFSPMNCLATSVFSPATPLSGQGV
jgi:hypothetical protein